MATVGTAVVLKLLGGHWISDADAVFLAAVSLTAWRVGVGPGLLAVVMSALAQAYLFLAPVCSLRLDSADEAIQLGLWSVEASLVCVLFGALRSARRRAVGRTQELAESNASLLREAEDRARSQRELARSEDQLRHVQTMDAVGRLAAGMAHDFNNILAVILSYADVLMSDQKPGDPLHADLGEIAKAARRAADLTRRLLLFGQQHAVTPRVMDLGEVLGGMEKTLKPLVGGGVELTWIADPRLARVVADPGLIEQVLSNLAVNARDAMPAGGKLTIEAANVVLDEDFARRHVGVRPGPHVMLAVSDTGIGMDAPTQSRIFEPFFTTKAFGKGSGLGLSTVFGIVQQSGGTVWVRSEPGKGSTFKIYLPIVERVGESERMKAMASKLGASQTALRLLPAASEST
jgi:signal transduction histidine kinase